ncbi:MAG: urease accessory protein UreE [Burkholderiaceae bacterium]
MRVFRLSAEHAAVPFDCLFLDFETRSKSRFKARLMTTQEEVGVLLPRGTVLRGGSLLSDGAGAAVEVVAADESLLRVGGSAYDRMRCAYHLGNRHVRLEVREDFLQLQFDSVLADMLRNLGVMPTLVYAPFEPEAGAYGGGHQHGHDTTFEEDYALAQAAFHVHAER